MLADSPEMLTSGILGRVTLIEKRSEYCLRTLSVTVIAKEHHQGDLVVFMSNGGFGGIHERMLRALSA